MDPISDQFPHVSTYNYAENEPVANIDLWGLQAFRYELNSQDNNLKNTTPEQKKAFYEGFWQAGAEVVDALLDEVPIFGEIKAFAESGVSALAVGLIPGGRKGKQAFEIVDHYADDVVKQASKTGTDAYKAAKADIAKESGEGIIYKVGGGNTPSGKPYVGSADDLSKRAKTAKDGRDRTSNTEVIGGYEKGNKVSRKIAEQQAIIDNGGIKNLDNKRNEIKSSDWKKYGIGN